MEEEIKPNPGEPESSPKSEPLIPIPKKDHPSSTGHKTVGPNEKVKFKRRYPKKLKPFQH